MICLQCTGITALILALYWTQTKPWQTCYHVVTAHNANRQEILDKTSAPRMTKTLHYINNTNNSVCANKTWESILMVIKCVVANLYPAPAQEAWQSFQQVCKWRQLMCEQDADSAALWQGCCARTGRPDQICTQISNDKCYTNYCCICHWNKPSAKTTP